MAPSITIVGGNIAGLSAAYYLARRGFTVTVYESRLWNKPCGGAISCEFARFLQTELGIFPEGIDYFVPGLRFAFTRERTFDNKGFFVVVSRYELQKRLIKRLSASPDIDIVFRHVRPTDRELLTPQTIVATGYGGFTRKVMGAHWHQLRSGLIFRYDGKAPGSRHPNRHLMVFESRLKGYGWVFIGKDDHVNIGVGGMIDRASIKQAYYDFYDVIADRYGYHMRVDNREPAAWKIPVLAKNWAHPVACCENGIEFIGAGDVLGLAHPIIGAGIEPAWQSGWLLAESVDAVGEKIDTRQYRHLLKTNLRLTARKPVDRALTALARSRMLPNKDSAGYVASRIITPYLLRQIRKYPWFAMVHDGRRKTGFRIPPHRADQPRSIQGT